MTQLSDKRAKLDNLGSLKALHISVHECNLLQLKQALAKKQLSSSESLAHFDILDSRPNSSERQDVQLYTSMISAGWSHGRTARAPSSLEASARRVVWSAMQGGTFKSSYRRCHNYYSDSLKVCKCQGTTHRPPPMDPQYLCSRNNTMIDHDLLSYSKHVQSN